MIEIWDLHRVVMTMTGMDQDQTTVGPQAVAIILQAGIMETGIEIMARLWAVILLIQGIWTVGESMECADSGTIHRLLELLLVVTMIQCLHLEVMAAHAMTATEAAEGHLVTMTVSEVCPRAIRWHPMTIRGVLLAVRRETGGPGTATCEGRCQEMMTAHRQQRG